MKALIARRSLFGLLALAGAAISPPSEAGEMQRRRRLQRRRIARRMRWYGEPVYRDEPDFHPRRYGLTAHDRMMIERHEVPSSYGDFGSPFFR
jgi:hypothetical protein